VIKEIRPHDADYLSLHVEQASQNHKWTQLGRADENE